MWNEICLFIATASVGFGFGGSLIAAVDMSPTFCGELRGTYKMSIIKVILFRFVTIYTKITKMWVMKKQRDEKVNDQLIFQDSFLLIKHFFNENSQFTLEASGKY